MKRRIMCLLLTLCMALSLLPASALAAEKQVYLALGDSISSGYGLSDKTKRFTDLVAAGKGYTQINHAVDGNTVSKMLETQLAGGRLDEDIAKADFITVTVGGNDMLAPVYVKVAERYNSLMGTDIKPDEITQFMLTASQVQKLLMFSSVCTVLEGDSSEGLPPYIETPEFEESLADMEEDLAQLMDSIRDLNYKAHVVITTQYHPYRSFASQFTALGEPLDECAKAFRKLILECAEEYDFLLADVYTAFRGNEKALCNADLATMNPDFHPNAAGHAVIAETILALELPERPEQPEQPEQPEEPEEPEQPEQPEEPEQPEQPEQPEEPEQPEQPEQPEEPEQPEQPEEPEKPEKPDDDDDDDKKPSRPSSSGSSGVEKYYIDAIAGNGGTIFPSGKVSVQEGNNKSFAIHPRKGYEIAYLVVDGEKVAAQDKYTFTKVEEGHTIEVVFRVMGADKNVTAPYKDLAPNAWYHEYVGVMLQRELMQGVSETAFAPDDPLSRAMLVQILYRIAGEPRVFWRSDRPEFDDVSRNAWYASAVYWAYDTQIITGKSESIFDPNGKVSREQFATILYRFARYRGDDVRIGDDDGVLAFRDADSISNYAVVGMQWAISEGLFSGVSEGYLAPRMNATRAQAAKLLYHFL